MSRQEIPPWDFFFCTLSEKIQHIVCEKKTNKKEELKWDTLKFRPCVW